MLQTGTEIWQRGLFQEDDFNSNVEETKKAEDDDDDDPCRC